MAVRQEQRRPRLGAEAPGPADLVVRDAAVYCGSRDGTPRFAEAVAVRDGRVVAVDDRRAMETLVGSGTVVVDAGGRTVVPGLIDSHVHVVRAGLTWTDEVVWFEVPSLHEAMARLHAAARARPPGSWLRVVGGWHPGQFAEGRGPTSEELTRAFPDHPVYVQLLYEEAVLNQAGLEAAGLAVDGADPPGGRVDRDAAGAPTGTVRGVGAFLHVLSRIPEVSQADAMTGTGRLLQVLNGWGLTGVVDPGGLGMTWDSYTPLLELWRAGEVTLRVRLYTGPMTRGQERDEVGGWLRHLRPGVGDDWLRYVGIGEIAVFGCHDLEGLAPFVVDDDSRAELERVARDVAAAGWPLHLHAVLDDTASTILDVWEKVAADHPIGALRWSLAHADAISPANLDRLAALGCGVAVQDRLVYRAADSARVWGADAVRRAPPLRDIVRRGIPLAAGTDATRVASPNPWVSIGWLVSGATVDGGPTRVPDQRLGRCEALDAYTVGSAWFSFEEQVRGRLEVGAAADFAVLSDDYFTVPDTDIASLSSELTLVDGRAVHASGDFAGLA